MTEGEFYLRFTNQEHESQKSEVTAAWLVSLKPLVRILMMVMEKVALRWGAEFDRYLLY